MTLIHHDNWGSAARGFEGDEEDRIAVGSNAKGRIDSSHSECIGMAEGKSVMKVKGGGA